MAQNTGPKYLWKRLVTTLLVINISGGGGGGALNLPRKFHLDLIFIIFSEPFVEKGVERIVDQSVHPKIYSVIEPLVEALVFKSLGVGKQEEEEHSGEPGNLYAIFTGCYS